MVAPPATKATSVSLMNFKAVPMRTFPCRETLSTIGIAATMVSFVSLVLSLSKNAQLVLVLNPKTRICTGRRYGLTYNLRYNTDEFRNQLR